MVVLRPTHHRKHWTGYEQYFQQNGRRVIHHKRQVGTKFVNSVNAEYQYGLGNGDHEYPHGRSYVVQ